MPSSQDGKKRYTPSIAESIYSSTAVKLPVIPQRKKIVHPLLSSTGIVPLPNIFNRTSNKNYINTEKILSFKEQRLKHLETQLADINLQINELSKENNLLKSIQKRHESSLKRYEDANGEIPKMINSHNEEIRSWQVRHNQLKLRFRDVVERTKGKDEELLSLTRDHDNLYKETREANIEERVSLNNELMELTERYQIQEDMINTLQRRIILQEKNHRHHMKLRRKKSIETRPCFQNGEVHNQSSSSTEDS